MKIPVPSVEQSVVRLIVGDEKTDIIQGTQKTVDVPEGVEVKAVGLDVLGKPVGEPFVVVAASAPSDPPSDPPADEPEQPAQPESAQPESAQPESVISLESELSLGQSEPEITSPFKGGVEKKGGPFKGPKAKGL